MSLSETLALYRGRRVLVTGHTGFKGAWLTLWLRQLGAEVMGMSLPPPSVPSLYEAAQIGNLVKETILDITDAIAVKNAFTSFNPEIVFHLAAQSLVRPSYANPVETLNTNIMGTAHILDACRYTSSLRAAVIITSDKCYRNNEWWWGYRENDPLGGFDPYSASKGCAEILVDAFRNSYFSPSLYGDTHNLAVASARAGNVIGGGDWAVDRIIPDCIRALMDGVPILIRSPQAIRPWQHVLESLSGYLILGIKLLTKGATFAEGWNFAPLNRSDIWPVEHVVQTVCELWGKGTYSVEKGPHPHEASLLGLDASKSYMRLEWKPRYNVRQALEQTVAWYRAWTDDKSSALPVTLNQIQQYIEAGTEHEAR